jgi:hypothetical protein
MPPKTGSPEVELKVRIPRDLYMQVNDYRHLNKLDSRKAAVVQLLSSALKGSSNIPPEPQADASKVD